MIEEKLKLDTAGYAYHPNLLSFVAGTLVGLQQHDYESEPPTDAAEGGSGRLLGFDVSTDILKQKRYPTTVFARRFQGVEPRPFFTSVRRKTEEYGLHWSYLSDRLPTRLQLDHNAVEYSPFGGTEEDRRHQSDQVRVDSTYIVSDSNKASLVYEHQSIERSPFEIRYDVDNLRLTHGLMFGEKEQHRLDSELSRYDQRGSLGLERSELRERLSLRHADSLRSWYEVDAVGRTQGRPEDDIVIEERSRALSAAVEHRLYESVITEIGGFVQDQDFDGAADTDQEGLHADVHYRKRNRWGVFESTYGYSRRNIGRHGSDEVVTVLDESHVFEDPDPIVLDGPGIILSTIVITDETGTETYTLDLDYGVVEFGNRVEIHRLPGGLIVDGQAVLVDFDLLNVGEYSLDTTGQRIGVRQTFSFGLAPYYRLSLQRQSVHPAEAIATLGEDVESRTLGVEYRKDGFQAMVEREEYASNISPYTARRAGCGYSHRFEGGSTARVGVGWSELHYEAPQWRKTSHFTLDGSYRHRLTEHASFEGMGRYLDDSDSLSLDNHGVDVNLALEWARRGREVRIVYETGSFENDFTRNDASRLYVELRAHF
ncbi:MAG: hypothetical protein AB1726_10335 [Planctomycetota bacterium]